jgi:hypothetical protein
MRYRRYRHTPVTCTVIADNIDDLQSINFLMPDVKRAAALAPLAFHPQTDPFFFNYDAYDFEPTQKQVLAQTVLTKFNTWYVRATPLERAYLVVSALTETYNHIDAIIDEVIDDLPDAPNPEADGDSVKKPDYVAVRNHIESFLNRAEILAFIELLQHQINRVMTTPAVKIDTLLAWSLAYRQKYAAVVDVYDNIFYRTGITQKAARKALHRSYQLLNRVFGADTARRFVRGEEIRITSHLFVWGLQIKSDLIESTIDPSNYHTPFLITLYDRDGTELCHGCIIWPKTPVLDQAIALKLAISSPEDEQELLNDINLSGISTAGIACETLKPYRAKTMDEYEANEGGVIGEPGEPTTVTVGSWIGEVTVTEDDGNRLRDERRMAVRVYEIGIRDNRWGNLLNVAAPARHQVEEDGLDEDEPVSPDAVDAIDAAYQRIRIRRNSWRVRRYQNDLVNLVQTLLFEKIAPRPIDNHGTAASPRAILDYMAFPDMCDILNDTRLRRYLTTKQF